MLIVGIGLGLFFGFVVVLYFEGGIKHIQEVFSTNGSNDKGTYLLLLGLGAGIFLGGILSIYLWAWGVVKIGLLTESERGPISIHSNS